MMLAKTDILLGGNIVYAGMLARFATCIGNYANERVPGLKEAKPWDRCVRYESNKVSETHILFDPRVCSSALSVDIFG